MSNDLYQPLSLEHLENLITQARTQVMTAILISLSMIAALLSFIATSFNLKRLSLIFGFIYSLFLCGIEVGYSKALGLAGCSIAAIGFSLSFKYRS